MKKSIGFILGIVSVLLFIASCQVENLEEISHDPKTDFTSFNYILATEDASDVDLTTFFAFNPADINPNRTYDLFDEDKLFINSVPSTSSGSFSVRQYVYSLAKDKKGYSSTPGLYRLTLNKDNRMFVDQELHISRDNLFPARQIAMVNEHLGYFYDEGKEPQSIQIFDPLEMRLKGSIDLRDAIRNFKPDAKWVDETGNNLVRTGSLVLDENQGKLYVSIVFLEAVGFNLIADSVNEFHVAVIDIQSNVVEKIITYHGAKTVAFYVSENKGTVKDEDGNLYFCSWGWNQFNKHAPSKVFRIKSGETDFDTTWVIDIESLFGKDRIAQSITSYNNKIYLHISQGPYTFGEDAPGDATLDYYEFDPQFPDQPKKLNIPSSNASTRMSIFYHIDDKLFVSVPNIEKGKFNGMYSIDKSGHIKKELTVENKYRITRFYKLEN